MSIYKKICFAFICFFLSTGFKIYANGSVSGTIVDKATGFYLAGVNIQIEGTLLGSSSDMYGYFKIANVPDGVYTIHASMIGYKINKIHNVKVFNNSISEVNFQLEETTIDFDPVIVTANKTRQELDHTANSLAVIASPEIKERYPLRVDKVLEAIPGVNLVREQVNIRGSTGYTIGAANRTLLLIDGIPVMTSDTGQFNWDLLPVLDIEQIEVIKGAGSALWGTSALGGVINIITKSPTDAGKTIIRLILGKYDKPRYDEWIWTSSPLQFGRVDVSHNQKIGSLGYRISVGRHVSTGYTEVGDFKRWNATAKFNYRFKNGSSWILYNGYNYNAGGIFVGWDDPQKPFQVSPANRNSRGKIEMVNFYSKYSWIISPGVALNFRISYLMSLMGNQFVKSADFNPARGLGAEIQGEFLLSPDIDITYGCELKWDTGNTKYFGSHKGYTIGIYGQTEYRLFDDKLRVTPGLRYDRYKLINGLSQDLLSPRFGINYRPFNTTILRASAGSGFRAATIAERYLNLDSHSVTVKSNPDLKAETSWSYDCGYRQYFTSNWYFEIGAFRNNFTNLIEIDLRQSQIEFAKDIKVSVQFENLVKAKIQGLEFTTSGYWWHNRLKLLATATFLDHEDLTTHQPLTYRPKIITYINPALQLGPWEFHIDYQFASRIEKVKLYQYDKRIPQKVWNFRLLYYFNNINLQFGINNFLDYYYTQIERNMEPPRYYTIGITGEF